MYCLHCKYTMKLRNDKEINALFASYKGVQWSPLHQPSSHCILPQNSQNPQKPLAEISSHGWHRCAQNFSPPSLDNCRRVWHPCHTHAPSQGVQWSPLHQQSSHCILPQNSQNPQTPLAEISSHRWHRCSQIFLTEIFSHGLHRTRRILAPQYVQL